jgi:hypothetical protein
VKGDNTKAKLVTSFVKSQIRGNPANATPRFTVCPQTPMEAQVRVRYPRRKEGEVLGRTWRVVIGRSSVRPCMPRKISEDQIMLAMELRVAVVVLIPTSSGSLT